MTKPFLKALQGKNNHKPPVWLMRQAGRYLTEYKKVRVEAGTFLDLCYNPELASEVSLQPIRKFGFDAAIIFSDILVIPHSMGVGLEYVEGEGPKLEKTDSSEKINNLKTGNVEKHLSPVFEAIRKTKEQLPENVAMIGFAGAPWTVATYMIAGKGRRFDDVRNFVKKDKKAFDKMIDILTEETKEYLSLQIKAGAEAVQIFDSWAEEVPESEFENIVIKPVKEITAYLKGEFPDVRVIGFPRGVGDKYEVFVKETGVDAVSIDTSVDVEWAAKTLQKHVCVQGNLDPEILAGNDKVKIISETKRILSALNSGPFIFNLGHGILPHTPVENVELLLETIRG